MTQYAERLARYKHLRQASYVVNNRLAGSLSRSVLDEGGKKLGILKRNVLSLDSEDELAVLMDFCIHNVRRNGVNAIERYLAESPPAPGSEEEVVLQALRQARYSLFTVEGTEPGVGVHVRDLLRDELLFITDVGFGSSARAGLTLASRIMAPEGIAMTTGAPLPLGVMSSTRRDQFLHALKASFPRMDLANPSSEEASNLAAAIIRICLQRGAAQKIAYVDPGQGKSLPHREPQALSPAQRIGRNDSCPCGSGKKFKRCCGTRDK